MAGCFSKNGAGVGLASTPFASWTTVWCCVDILIERERNADMSKVGNRLNFSLYGRIKRDDDASKRLTETCTSAAASCRRGPRAIPATPLDSLRLPLPPRETPLFSFPFLSSTLQTAPFECSTILAGHVSDTTTSAKRPPSRGN